MITASTVRDTITPTFGFGVDLRSVLFQTCPVFESVLTCLMYEKQYLKKFPFSINDSVDSTSVGSPFGETVIFLSVAVSFS